MTRDSFVRSQTSRFSAALRKLLSIKGEEHGIDFGVHLEEERPEYSFLKGETRWAQFNQATSAAGTLSVVGVFNPANSNVLCVITDIFAYLSTPATIDLQTRAGAVPGAGSSTGGMFSTDLRAPRAQTTSKGFAGATAAYAGHIVSQVVILVANDIMDLVAPAARVHPIILPPGSECAVNADAVGVNTLSAIFVGYERTLESGELQP